MKPKHAGKRIRSLADIYDAATSRRAIIGYQTWAGRRPASWVLMMQGCTLHFAIRDGLWIYKPTTKPKRRTTHE